MNLLRCNDLLCIEVGHYKTSIGVLSVQIRQMSRHHEVKTKQEMVVRRPRKRHDEGGEGHRIVPVVPLYGCPNRQSWKPLGQTLLG